MNELTVAASDYDRFADAYSAEIGYPEADAPRVFRNRANDPREATWGQPSANSASPASVI